MASNQVRVSVSIDKDVHEKLMLMFPVYGLLSPVVIALIELLVESQAKDSSQMLAHALLEKRVNLVVQNVNKGAADG